MQDAGRGRVEGQTQHFYPGGFVRQDKMYVTQAFVC